MPTKKTKKKPKPKPKRPTKPSKKQKKKKKPSGEVQTIKFTTLYQGPQGSPNPFNDVIQTPEDLMAAFGAAWPFANKVKFPADEVIVVALGSRPTSGYTAQITEVLYLPSTSATQPAQTEITYTEIAPTGPTNDVMTNPMHVVRLKHLDGVASFNEA
jgi:hypothetical protein